MPQDLFDYDYYNPNDTGLSSAHSDAYANNGFVISFFHMISSKNVRFKAFLKTLNETYSPDYSSETVFGRADPIYTYKNTTRNISLAFAIPAASTGEAYENLAKVQTLIQMLYPAYTDINNALTVAQAPLVRLKVMNIVRKNSTLPEVDDEEKPLSAKNLYDSYTSTDNVENGLLGIIQNVTVQHNLENESVATFEKTSNTVLPQTIEVNVDFRPLHEHALGWKEGNKFSMNSFPYGALQYGNAGQHLPPAAAATPANETNSAALDSADAEGTLEGTPVGSTDDVEGPTPSADF